MRRSMVLMTLAVGAAALAVSLLGKSDKPVTAQAADTQVDVNALRAEIASLKRDVRQQSLRSLAISAQQQAEPVQEEDERAHAAPEPAEVEAKSELTPAQELVALNEVFYDQPRDTAWSRSVMPLAASELKRYLTPESRLKSLECRESLCRAEAEHANADRYREFMHMAFTQSKWNGASVIKLQGEAGDGPMTSILYLIKPDTDLRAMMTPEEQ